MPGLVATLLALLALASPSGTNAQTYTAATYLLENSDGLGPGANVNRAFGAAVHASDGLLLAAVNSTCGELFTSIPSTQGGVPVSTTMCMTDADEIAGDQLTDRADHFAFADGVVVIGTPNRERKTGGADVWRWDASSSTLAGPAALGSGDGRIGHMGTAAATSGGDVIVLGAPKDDNDKGAAYVFLDYAKNNAWTRSPARLFDPDGAAGDEFGGVVAVHNGDEGTGNGWIVVASLKSASNAGAVHLFARAGSPGAYAWFWSQTVTPVTAGTPKGFGAGLAMTGRYLLVATRPSAVGETDGGAWGEVYYLAGPNSTTHAFTVDGSAAPASIPNTGTWVLDGPGGVYTTSGTAKSAGTCAIDGDTAVLGAVGSGDDDGRALVFRRQVDDNDLNPKWKEQTQLAPSDWTSSGLTTFKGFGRAVAVDNGVVTVAASQPLDGSDDGKGEGEASSVGERRGGVRARVVCVSSRRAGQVL